MNNTQNGSAGFAASGGSANYIAVRCAVCGHKDGLRKDLFEAGDMRFFCDECDEWGTCKVEGGAESALVACCNERNEIAGMLQSVVGALQDGDPDKALTLGETFLQSLSERSATES